MAGKQEGKPRRVPKLGLHKSSGRGYVTDPDTGKQKLFARFGTPECARAYESWVAEFLTRKPGVPAPGPPLTVARLARAYLAHAETYYVKHGEPTSQVRTLRAALRYLVATCPDVPADRFTVAHLKQVREAMVAAGMTRKVVNAWVGKVRGVWRWGVEEELVDASAYGALRAVRGLARGRTPAPDRPKVRPAPEADIEAVLPFLRPRVRAMVLLQRWAGMRPQDVVRMRPADVDRLGAPWVYRPEGHKTEHHGLERKVYLGPKCREVLAPLLDAAPSPAAYLFPSRRKGAGHFRVESLTLALRVACRKAGVPHFSAARLRHSAATEVRAAYGLEAAQVILGHSELRTTQVYAERDEALARKVAEDLS